MEAIILAGGLGTRLRSEVKDVPKSMAMIQNRPFLEYLLDRLISQGIQRIIFSVGYKSEHIREHFSDSYKGCELVYAIEDEPLGTGGAIQNAMKSVSQEQVFVMNGDSLFVTDLQEIFQFHIENDADVTFALKPMKDISRYGTVRIDEEGRILEFFEKQPVAQGLINTGVYLFNASVFKQQELPRVFSIEKDFFETKVNELQLMGVSSDGYFLDIGIPSDFKKAQYEIGLFPEIDSEWTLFLDRDGVINKKRPNDYVKNLDELILLPGAVDAIAFLSTVFGRVIIVTNQQGVGKQLMSHQELGRIHDNILQEVKEAGGHIDAIYYAPQLKSEGSLMRKPEIGMALEARKDFPEIDFAKSLLVGDSQSDMQFAENAGMIPIRIQANASADSTYYTLTGLAELAELIRKL